VKEGPLTDDSQIQIVWDVISEPQSGYGKIISYAVYWDNGNNGAQWALLVEETSSFTFTYTKNVGILRANYY
jgi:hypothetical protein